MAGVYPGFHGMKGLRSCYYPLDRSDAGIIPQPEVWWRWYSFVAERTEAMQS